MKRNHSKKCNCDKIDEALYKAWTDEWNKAKSNSEKQALVAKLISKRIHCAKVDKVTFEFNKLYVCRDCLVLKLGISEGSLSKYSKQGNIEYKWGKHGNRINRIS